jgi:hypothetical protein
LGYYLTQFNIFSYGPSGRTDVLRLSDGYERSNLSILVRYKLKIYFHRSDENRSIFIARMKIESIFIARMKIESIFIRADENRMSNILIVRNLGRFQIPST